jgi:hypothetical protein
MSHLTKHSNMKFASLEELKLAHAKILLFHACQVRFKREPTDHEITYWCQFLLNGGDLHEMLKRLPEGPGEVLIAPEVVVGASVASADMERAAAETMTVDKLGPEIKPKSGAHQGVITLVGKAGVLYAGRPAKIYVLVENLSAITWVSGQVQPVFACYHWLDATGNVIIYDGIRSRLPEAIEPAARKQVPVSVIAPPVAGEYTLEVTLVHEGVTWMEDDGLTSLRLELTIDPSVSESGLKIMKELQWAKESAVEKFK